MKLLVHVEFNTVDLSNESAFYELAKVLHYIELAARTCDFI